MAKTTWFIGGVKHKAKKKKPNSTKSKATLSKDGKLTLTLPGTAFAATDPEKERDPPPEPTPVTFPPYVEWTGEVWTKDKPPPNFQRLFSRVSRPTDISHQHLEALNIITLPKCSANELAPDPWNPLSYLDRAAIEPESESEPTGDVIKAQARISRQRKDFDDRIAELSIDNDLAFKVLSKRVPVGTRPPRLAFMRKFYEGLESMSQYWDCSLDQYYKVQEEHEAIRGEEGDKCVKRQRLEHGFSPRGSPDPQTAPGSERTLPIIAPQLSDGTPENKTTPQSSDPPRDQTPAPENIPLPKDSLSPTPPPPNHLKRYKGRRTGTGRSMPDQFRTDTIRAFIEGTVWAFHAALSIPRTMPLVQFNKLNLPVRQTAAAYRMPGDRTRARAGWQEGPILSVQVRAETEFLDANGDVKEQMARLDFMREIAALLQLTQERRREGRKEVKPGEGKWWTTVPRWGGGEGGDAQNEIGNTDILAAAEEMVGAAKDKNGVARNKDGSRLRQRKTPAMLWKELKVGRGNWDPKTEYTAIGKKEGSEWDQVFLISSLNHHISILKLFIHGAYTDYLTSATLPDPPPQDPDWSRPKLQRTEWLDLFDVEQRLEAFRGLWAVMAYLTRETTTDKPA